MDDFLISLTEFIYECEMFCSETNQSDYNTSKVNSQRVIIAEAITLREVAEVTNYDPIMWAQAVNQ